MAETCLNRASARFKQNSKEVANASHSLPVRFPVCGSGRGALAEPIHTLPMTSAPKSMETCPLAANFHHPPNLWF